MLLGSVLGLALLSAVGVRVYGVRNMSDPQTPLLVGIRVDGSRISVKAPTCPTDKVGTVEVYDSDSDKLLWRASGPKTPEDEQGAVTLWKADDFSKAGPKAQPKTLPTNLDISVTYTGTKDGAGDTFNVPRVESAHIPEEQYWTYDGPKTAAQLDAQLKCGDRT
ncbi:hypothetical protein [Streptomyces sp. Ru72]|uniref:hypothetical protein n=1 Tax=Streptomyces sp. Ru72 TaxID=2080747 RepID=UPI000CDDBD30|nr:hypothetical protein [Streptomyces sp. Ru72]POX50882.1 hypothetical protein C3488_12960 [Streptomyces sp. Ru72]